MYFQILGKKIKTQISTLTNKCVLHTFSWDTTYTITQLWSVIMQFERKTTYLIPTWNQSIECSKVFSLLTSFLQSPSHDFKMLNIQQRSVVNSFFYVTHEDKKNNFLDFFLIIDYVFNAHCMKFDQTSTVILGSVLNYSILIQWRRKKVSNLKKRPFKTQHWCSLHLVRVRLDYSDSLLFQTDILIQKTRQLKTEEYKREVVPTSPLA